MTKNDILINNIVSINLPKLNSVLSGSSTYTTLFMLPAFDIYVDEILHNMFVNAYIDDVELKHIFTHPLFFLLSVEDVRNIRFVKMDQYLRENVNYVYSYPVGKQGTKNLIMYVYECPEIYISDYKQFLESKYSLFSPTYKRCFTQFVRNSQGNIIESPIYGVLHKTNTMKIKMERKLAGYLTPDLKLSADMELFGEIKKQYEIFRIKQQN